ncbi:uncharacterized protein LOC119339929 [Triticum dicoccoides]|uniref:uncharacterized protein LOC119339929 n=1 Tax=Triticum dicoccoides TaxID=85692 RepID=UPI001891A676|nr:uncharacterized protein LOC119339929 [Triticum dicoccoides]XP_037467728.1 uncharacterized protein LOC119339929 [Triticum dicoccoides]XP_037467729.1 uncharacterized protein LOC119339929 [Triticum dicoccoides]
MPCHHMLKVMDIFGYTEIPQQLIVKRWTRDAKDILPANLQIYQQDHAGSRTMTHRHTVLYCHAMELVRLGDACVESYQRGMQIIRDEIASLSEFEDKRDGLGLEDHPTITPSAIPDPQKEMREVACAEQGAQVETLAGLGAPEKKRTAGRPTNSHEKAPLEGLSKQTRFCSICNGKGHKKTTCPDGDLPKQPRKEVKCSNCDVAGHKRIPAPTLRVSSCKQRLQPTARGASPSTNKSESGVVNWSRAPSISWPCSGVTSVLVWKTDSDAFYQAQGTPPAPAEEEAVHLCWLLHWRRQDEA